jgi:hypothetical protein
MRIRMLSDSARGVKWSGHLSQLPTARSGRSTFPTPRRVRIGNSILLRTRREVALGASALTGQCPSRIQPDVLDRIEHSQVGVEDKSSCFTWRGRSGQRVTGSIVGRKCLSLASLIIDRS